MNKDVFCEALSAAVEPDYAAALNAPAHTFSPRFEKKMDRLIRKEKKPLWRYTNTFGKRLALAALLLVLCLGGLFTASADARGFVIRMFQSDPKIRNVTFVLTDAVAQIGDDMEVRPYIDFSTTEGKHFRMGQGLMFSYGLDGVYDQKGDIVTIKRTEGSWFGKVIEDAWIELRVLSESEIQVIKVSDAFFSDQSWSWFKEGDVLAYREPDPIPGSVENFEFLVGYYLSGIETEYELTPMILFDSETMSWESSQDAQQPFCMKGTFTVDGDRIIAQLENDSRIAFEMQIISDTKMKVLAARDDIFPVKDYHWVPDFKWIHEGQEYHYVNWDPSVEMPVKEPVLPVEKLPVLAPPEQFVGTWIGGNTGEVFSVNADGSAMLGGTPAEVVEIIDNREGLFIGIRLPGMIGRSSQLISFQFMNQNLLYYGMDYFYYREGTENPYDQFVGTWVISSSAKEAPTWRKQPVEKFTITSDKTVIFNDEEVPIIMNLDSDNKWTLYTEYIDFMIKKSGGTLRLEMNSYNGSNGSGTAIYFREQQ